MSPKTRSAHLTKFLVYLAVVVLVNVAGITLFFRVDLTSDHMYSLSEASKKAVRNLSEPLTINVFFTKNLPAPHNATERYLHDLLEEYSVNSNRYFNYRFYDVSAEEGDIGEEERRNQELARSYGIYPVQIEKVEQDEVKFQKAYMGMVLIHGDVIEKIPTITSTDGLEFTITSKIEKISNKISALTNLEEPIKIKLFFSSSLEQVAPELRMDRLFELPERLKTTVDELNDKYFGKLAFSRLDPTEDPSLEQEASGYNVLSLKWPSIKDRRGNETIPEGRAWVGLVVVGGDKYETIPLIHVVRIPLFGTQYQLADLGSLKEKLGEAIDNVIDINKKIGYLADHGTLPLREASPLPGHPGTEPESISNFNKLLSENYSITEVRLKDEGIPEGIDCLIIAGPKEEFSDYELFQIDQFLMKGKSLALFLDSFEEVNLPQNPRSMGYGNQPVYTPINTGLEKLLGHYGVSVKKSYALDENCYEQKLPLIYGGGKRPIYFAPIIKSENINRDLPFMKRVKGLVVLKSSPVEIKKDTIEKNGISHQVLFSSSDRSWEMSGRIDLNPMIIRPPSGNEMKSWPLAVMLEGEFPSYFAGKEIPEKPVEKESDESDETAKKKGTSKKQSGKPESQPIAAGEGVIVSKGKPGKVFVIGTSELLKNNMLDEKGESPNATFMLNLLDDLNGRDDYARMRSKTQQFNPLRESGPGVRAFVKTFNIAGLPVLVALFGILVWMRRAARKRAIQTMFSK